MDAGKRRYELASRLTRRGLYLVTDDRLGDSDLLARLAAALEAGADVVQFRQKSGSTRQRYHLGLQIADLCRRWSALFLVNDEVDLALALDADGVHLGQEDLPVAVARRILGPARLLGVSISHLHEVRPAEESGADYLGVGSIYPTTTKQDAEPATLELLGAVRRTSGLPIIAIGGINAANAGPVIRAGADAIAVVSAVFGRADSGQATRELLDAIEDARLKARAGG